MNNLREIRNKRGFSQLTLAKLTNIAPTDISRIENNWLRPYPDWRKRLAKALGTTESELFPAENTSGHGRCLTDGCNCQQFTWLCWTDEAKLAIEDLR